MVTYEKMTLVKETNSETKINTKIIINPFPSQGKKSKTKPTTFSEFCYYLVKTRNVNA